MTDSTAVRNARNSGNGEDIARPKRRGRKSKSMHDGIAVWCDCCSCEAEPYWAELADEMGVELYNDYEDE